MNLLNAIIHFVFCPITQSEVISKTYRAGDGSLSSREKTEYLHRCKHCGHTWKTTLLGKEIELTVQS